MNDQLDPIEDPGTGPDRALQRLLARADVWVDSPDLEDAVVAAIASEAGVTAIERPDESLDDRRSDPTSDGRRRRAEAPPSMPWWLAAAAVTALLVAGVALVTRGGDGGDDGGEIELVLAGTDAAPGASARVTMAATPAGLKIVLDAEGLAPAPEGSYYEAWISDGTIRVSAGGFHLRDGHGPIELWAGVADPAFHILSVTLEPIDADTDSSGDIRLRGEFDLDT